MVFLSTTHSEGYVCFRAYVNPETGCCSAFYPSEEKKIGKLSKTVGGSSQSDAEDSSPSQTFSKDLAVNFDQTQPQLGQYSCFSCDSGSHCCQEYEMCVSCCMDPANRDVLEKFKSQSTHFVYQHTPLGFEFCRYKCRTSSGSVQNENSYRNPVKYCYGELLPELIPGSTVNSNGDTLNVMVKWGQKEVPMEPQKGVHQELRKATDLRHGTQYDPYFKEEGNGAAGFNQQGKIWGSLHDEEAQALAAPAEGGLVSKIWGSLGAEEALAGPAESVLVGEFRLEEPANAPPGQDSQIGGSLRGETSRAGQSKDPPNKIIPPPNSTPELKIITSKVQPELDEVG
uniref:SREBP regulating gene protein n=1 Tax=Heterosigma akashiwo TaxID=2829 RepID=A0A7S3XM96_HETAK|mmetsp:Transcript_45892/g.75012  ORF Transcript_45892/g.75012 Transcript_45892/m.75012 type:complete len:341 (+) Transcript_45892:120-1142(+)